MLLQIIAIGSRMPSWVNAGFDDYIKRMPPDFKVRLIEIPSEKRTKNSQLSKILDIESEKLWATIPSQHYKIILDRKGQNWDTLELAKNLGKFRDLGQNISFLIGGPEGISETILKKADVLWSLSPLTLPHPLVRLFLAEQFYRAWSILSKHPYHR